MGSVAYAENVIEDMLQQYNAAGVLPFSAERGRQAWIKEVKASDGKMRRCASCHGIDLSAKGKHVKSGKVIEPMAVSANEDRFTKQKKINKWFKRNCKWTWGRECTAWEKGDFLMYFQQN